MFRPLIPICAAAFLLAAAAPAQAGWKLDRAQKIAERVWNYDYGCPNGIVDVAWGDPAEVAPSHIESNSEPLAWASQGVCVVYLNAPRTAKWGMPWEELCPAMIHEYGHLAGREHSTDPHSIMYPDIHADRRCRDRGRPYMRHHNLYPG